MASRTEDLFYTEFVKHRQEYADTPAERIRAAGKPTSQQPYGEGEQWWLTHGPDMVARWCQWRDASGWRIWRTPQGVPGIELEINTVIAGRQLTKMFIDRIFVTPTNAVVVVDLKTGKRSPESDLQLAFYAAGLKEQFDVDVAGAAYWMARTGELSPIVDLTRFTPALIGHYAEQFQQARKAGIFLPKVTNLCRACGVRTYCVAYGGEKQHLDPDWKYITNGGTGHE